MSAALASVTGSPNTLQLPGAKRVIVLLVDGLGRLNLEEASGHARFLNSTAGRNIPCSCAFPSTTVASLTSLATGLSVGRHGLVGYRVWDAAAETTRNLLTDWSATFPAREWQSAETVFENASLLGLKTNFIGPPEYQRSGFTEATFGASDYLPAKSIEDRFRAALGVLASPASSLTYLYVPELDQMAHRSGFGSAAWAELLETVDHEVSNLAGRLGKQDLLLLTADHGIVDVPQGKQFYLDELLPADSLRAVGGDPRVLFLYLERAGQRQSQGQSPSTEYDEDSAAAMCARLTEKSQGAAVFLNRPSVLELGLYPDLDERFVERLPEIFAFAGDGRALYHRAFAKPKSLAMIGQHGGLSAQELSVPLKVYQG